MENPKISILMGAYNCEDTLPQAIDSILNQTYANWQLIICDDKSTDNTFSIAVDYASKNPDKIIVIKNDVNIKLAASLNHCFQYATGEFIARMDADDISTPDRLQTEVSFILENPQYDLVGTYMKSFDENGENHIIPIKNCPEKTDLPKFNPFHHATILMKKSVFEKLGGYNISKLTQRCEDVDLWFRFFSNGYKGFNIDKPLYLVREDRKAFKRRTLIHSIEASRVLFRGTKLLKLPFWYYLFCLKPVVSIFTPTFIKRGFRNKMDENNRKELK